MTRPWRAALVGCGRMGTGESDYPPGLGLRSHAGALRACPDTVLAGACDPSPEALARCRELFHVPAGFARLEEMLAAVEPEIVCVATPDATHGDVLRTVLSAPSVRAVLTEKPLTLDSAEGAQLVALAAERGTLLAVNYSRRFAPPIRRAKEWLRSSGAGPLQAVTGYYTKGLLRNGSHWLDLARFLVGEVRSVRAVDRLRDDPADASLDVEIAFESGVPGLLRALDSRRFDHLEMDLVAAAGRLRLTSLGDSLEIEVAADSPRHSGYRELVLFRREQDVMRDVALHAVTEVVSALGAGTAPVCSGRDGLAALALVEAARRSVQKRTWCPPEPPA